MSVANNVHIEGCILHSICSTITLLASEIPYTPISRDSVCPSWQERYVCPHSPLPKYQRSIFVSPHARVSLFPPISPLLPHGKVSASSSPSPCFPLDPLFPLPNSTSPKSGSLRPCPSNQFPHSRSLIPSSLPLPTPPFCCRSLICPPFAPSPL